MTPFQPTDRIAATLEAQQWNTVIAGLQELQRTAGAVIASLGAQLNAAVDRSDDATMRGKPADHVHPADQDR